jgi:AbrB family looped-hinge helix DNA binding protein
MRTTIDAAGRLVVPSAIRAELGLQGGDEVDIALRDGVIQVEPARKPVRLVEREGFLAAELGDADELPLTVDEVRDVLERVRR